jgi:multiple sugar transport system substrate-binding protein
MRLAWINKLAISANTKNPDSAWALVQHLVSQDMAEQLAYLYGGLPARTDLADAEFLEGVSPGFTEASAYIVPQPAHHNMLIIAREINTAVERAVRLQAEPSVALADLDATINQINGV